MYIYIYLKYRIICSLNGNDSADVSGGKVSKIIGPAIGLKGKVNLRMPDEALLEEVFGCQRGCLGGLCVSNIRKLLYGA